jgi:hypothetical protein
MDRLNDYRANAEQSCGHRRTKARVNGVVAGNSAGSVIVVVGANLPSIEPSLNSNCVHATAHVQQYEIEAVRAGGI